MEGFVPKNGVNKKGFPIVFSKSDLGGGEDKFSEKAKHTRICPSFGGNVLLPYYSPSPILVCWYTSHLAIICKPIFSFPTNQINYMADQSSRNHDRAHFIESQLMKSHWKIYKNIIFGCQFTIKHVQTFAPIIKSRHISSSLLAMSLSWIEGIVYTILYNLGS